MKKMIFLTVALIFISQSLFSQITDETGKKITRGNIALIVQEDFFTNGQRLSAKSKSDLNTATYAWVSKQLIDWGFQIVNRDDEAMSKVSKLLKESKSEHYLEGLSIQAKEQGADFLLLVDMTTLSENNKNITTDYSYRLVNITTNGGYHAKTRTEIVFENEKQLRDAVKKQIADNTIFFSLFIRRFFPAQFIITSMKGKKVTLGALQPIGSVYTSDKFYFYDYETQTTNSFGETMSFDVLNLLATANAKDMKLESGQAVVEVDQKFENKQNIYAALSEKNTLQHQSGFTTTVIGLQYDLDSKDGYIKKMVNQAVYCGLGQLPHFWMVESDLLPFLNKERELQKTEDFLNGHTVEQMKAVGTQYLIHISNFSNNNNIVSFTLSFLDVASNTIAKTFDCQCHISNLDKLVYYKLKSIFVLNCIIDKADKKGIDVLVRVPLDLKMGDNSYHLVAVKPIQTPDGQITYQRVEIVKLKYAEYKGMKHRFEFDKIINKDEFKDLEKNKDKYNFLLLNKDETSDKIK